jgi:alcohol dehydrogenase YqhD (iron-dependent ADH family)
MKTKKVDLVAFLIESGFKEKMAKDMQKAYKKGKLKEIEKYAEKLWNEKEQHDYRDECVECVIAWEETK